MELVRQLYQVVTTKQLFLEWLLEINMYFGKKLLKALAVEEVNQCAKTNEYLDIRTVLNRVRQNIIHDEEVLKMRWDLCSSCEFLKDNKCDKCGCFMKVKHKMAIASCPIGKWDRYAN